MSKFKEGDIVVCVKTNRSDWYAVGKDYTVISYFGNEVAVIDDQGVENQHGISSDDKNLVFVLASEYKKQINSKENSLPKEFKIRIKDKTHSRLVQEWLFERGIKWMAGECKPRHLTKGSLYIVDKEILCVVDGDVFEQENCSEVEFDIITTVTPRIVSTPVETIEIKGKKYNLEDVLKAIEDVNVNALD